MANTVTGVASAALNFAFTPGAGFLAGQQFNLVEALRTVFRIGGVLADQVDLISVNTYTFVASTPQTKDMTTDLTDIQGTVIVPARARLLAFRPKWTTDVPLVIGDSVTNEWDGFLSAAGTLKIFPSTTNNDGWTVISAPQTLGIPITSTSKTLKFDPQTAAGDVDFIFAGCSV